jgi:hypothetical protein
VESEWKRRGRDVHIFHTWNVRYAVYTVRGYRYGVCPCLSFAKTSELVGWGDSAEVGTWMFGHDFSVPNSDGCEHSPTLRTFLRSYLAPPN